MDIVVDKVILYASSADFSMPWPLKLTAISSIGKIGKEFMLKIIQGLEEVIIVNLPELYVSTVTISSVYCNLICLSV